MKAGRFPEFYRLVLATPTRSEAVLGLAAGASALAMLATARTPSWLAMWIVASVEFFALKAITLHDLRDARRAAPTSRVFAYLFLWPGMNARAFLREGPERIRRPTWHEVAFATAKLMLGMTLLLAAIRSAPEMSSLARAVSGMLGIIFTLHFGVFHLVSCGWRWRGRDAPPIMRNPIGATSLSEFWSLRWNVAFAESARRFIFHPLARRYGAMRAGLAVFIVSGVVHETVVSLPARGGWGGPTLYFLLQAAGLAVERSGAGRRIGLGRGVRGWIWTLLVTVSPVPLLFHEPFRQNVIIPSLRALDALLP